MVRLNEGMDEAIHEAVRTFTHRHEEIRDRFVGRLMTEAVELAGGHGGGVRIALRRGNMAEVWAAVLDELRVQHPVAQLYTMREIVLAHGAYWDVATNAGTTTMSLVWPRTPFAEVPART